MTLFRLSYVHRYRDRHGKIRHYARFPGRKKVALHGAPGSSQFMAEYEAARELAERVQIGAKRTKPGSVSELIVAYYDDLSFRAFSPSTRAMRRAILETFRNQYGDRPVAPLRDVHVRTLLGTKKPFAARNWLKTLRGLFGFAKAANWVRTDPTAGIKIAKARGGEIHLWTETEIEKFERRHAIGSQARLALALLLYTAQRRGDVVRMGPQHVRFGMIAVRQEKTGASLEIPIHPRLAEILDAASANHLAYLVIGRGKPFSPAGFGNAFRGWCREAGLPEQCSAHGLRKAACRRLAEAGATEHEIASISGHRTLTEVQRYTRAARQRVLARAGMDKVAEAF